MPEFTPSQKAWLDSYNAGAKQVINALHNKLYNIPESWKTGNTKALFDIITHTLYDIEKSLTKEEKDNGEQITAGPGF